jgi:flagellar motor switch protein FliM
MQSDHLTQDNRWIKLLTRQLQTAEVELVCNFGSTEVRLRDIVNMRVGDVIPLDVPDRLQGEVDGIPVLELTYGRQGANYAVRVERFLANDEEISLLGGQNG